MIGVVKGQGSGYQHPVTRVRGKTRIVEEIVLRKWGTDGFNGLMVFNGLGLGYVSVSDAGSVLIFRC